MAILTITSHSNNGPTPSPVSAPRTTRAPAWSSRLPRAPKSPSPRLRNSSPQILHRNIPLIIPFVLEAWVRTHGSLPTLACKIKNPNDVRSIGGEAVFGERLACWAGVNTVLQDGTQVLDPIAVSLRVPPWKLKHLIVNCPIIISTLANISTKLPSPERRPTNGK